MNLRHSTWRTPRTSAPHSHNPAALPTSLPRAGATWELVRTHFHPQPTPQPPPSLRRASAEHPPRALGARMQGLAFAIDLRVFPWQTMATCRASSATLRTQRTEPPSPRLTTARSSHPMITAIARTSTTSLLPTAMLRATARGAFVSRRPCGCTVSSISLRPVRAATGANASMAFYSSRSLCSMTRTIGSTARPTRQLQPFRRHSAEPSAAASCNDGHSHAQAAPHAHRHSDYMDICKLAHTHPSHIRPSVARTHECTTRAPCFRHDGMQLS